MCYETKIAEFEEHLHSAEYAPGTIDKYLRDVRDFASWLAERQLDKPIVAEWKEHLVSLNLAPTTVNSILASTNNFLRFIGRPDCCVKELRVQRKLFRNTERELAKEEYPRSLLRQLG